jgi:hypothetical protein
MDPRTSFPKTIDLATAAVIDFPALLFFCGGYVGSVSSSKPASVRDAVYRAFTIKYTDQSSRIFLAEQFKDWTQDNVYGELFSFEKDLASLSSAIVIFLESAGSIAELGAFSQQEGVKQKLLIFLQTKHYKQDSFIKLGPIKYLEDSFDGSVRPYPWQVTDYSSGSTLDEDSLSGSMDEICDAIAEVLGANRVQRKFDTEAARDQMLLIRDVIAQLIGLKLHEIESCLRDMGVALEIRRLKQYLYVLKTLNLIDIVPRGKDRFYIAKDGRQFIRYGTKDGSRFDGLRLQAEVAAYYQQHDISRFKAIAPVLAKLEDS